MTIEIINYNPKYGEDTVTMWRVSMAEAIGREETHSVQEHLTFLNTFLVVDNIVRLALHKEEDLPVGIIAIDTTKSMVNQLYIHQDYQGQGIGTLLLNDAFTLLPDKIELYTFEVNKRAQQFYENKGFKIVKRGVSKVEKMPDILYRWEPQKETP